MHCKICARALTTLSAIFLAAGPAFGDPSPVFAQELHDFKIDKIDLSTAVREFGTQSGTQILASGKALQARLVNAVAGHISAEQALSQMLRGTGLTYQYVGDRTIAVLVRDPASGDEAPAKVRAKPAPDPETPSAESSIQEITVTARKTQESVVDVPISIAVLSAKTLSDFDIRNFDDYATKISNMSFAYGGASSGFAGLGFSTSRGTAIRGVAGINTTGFYIDDTPVFDSMDPRIVDVERIEVLKGPQGTLYGSGSMGGNVRIITRKPSTTDDDVRYSVFGGYTEYGGFDHGLEAAGNVVLSPGVLGARLMGFYDYESPFLTRRFPEPGVPGVFEEKPDGAEGADGASLALLLTPLEHFSATLRLLYQRSYTMGWPAPFAPLPAFEVVSYTLNRVADAQEASTDRWTLPSLELEYSGSGWSLNSSTSYIDRNSYDREDGTEGTTYAYEQYGFTPPSGVPLYWYGYTRSTRLAQETRLSIEEQHRLRGLVGVYYAKRTQVFDGPPQYTPGLAESGLWPNDDGFNGYGSNPTREIAVFGELYWHLLDPLTLTLGARTYWLREQSTVEAGGFFEGGPFVQPLTTTYDHGTSPKYALDYHFSKETVGYAVASKGYRPGGINLTPPASCYPEEVADGITPQSAISYKSDSVWSYEGGVKHEFTHGSLITGSIFQIDWNQIQQAVYFPICGYGITGNSGAARIRGGEFELTGELIASLNVHLSVGYLDPVITQRGNSSPQPVGSPIFNTPRFTGSAALEQEFPILGDTTGFVSADTSYVSDSLSGNNTAQNPRVRPPYAVTDFSLGVRHKEHEISLVGKNIFDRKANLGDLTFLSFEPRMINAMGQSVPDPRVATLRPFQVLLQYRYGFGPH